MVDVDREVRREPIEVPVELDPGIEVGAGVGGRGMRRHPLEAEQAAAVAAPARPARVPAGRMRDARAQQAQQQRDQARPPPSRNQAHGALLRSAGSRARSDYRGRAGSTSPDLWPPGSEPAVEYTRDIDDWLAVIATGRCVGITPESTVTQYRRQGIAFRPLRDAAPVPVWLIWRRQDPHPATHAAVALAADLYRAAALRELPG
jgi:hypothetical protein